MAVIPVRVELSPELAAGIERFLKTRQWTVSEFLAKASRQLLDEYARQEVRRRAAGQPARVPPAVPSRDLTTQVCALCDKPFTPWNHGRVQRFCSPSHAKYAQRYGSIEKGRAVYEMTQRRKAVTR
jgi:hypothetical protein